MAAKLHSSRRLCKRCQTRGRGLNRPPESTGIFPGSILHRTGISAVRADLGRWDQRRRSFRHRKDKGQGERRETSRSLTLRRALQVQLISSRTVPFIDTQSLSECHAREALLHDNRKGFILYLSSGAPPSVTEERVLFLGPREALIWLNEPAEERGSFWV